MDYEIPETSAFFELRRGLPLVAAALFVAALWFPMWRIAVNAVQYPSTTLHLELYAYPRIAGDYAEMANLNKYIGFYYPDPVYWQPNYEPHPRAVDVPEWSFGPLAFVAVSACAAFVALAPDTERLKRGLTAQLVGTATVFAAMLADIQYRLYQAGHTLDPDAPVMGVDGFTPPLWGSYEVANITSYSRFGLGAYMSMAAVALLAVAFYYRDSDATLRDVVAGARARIDRARDRGAEALQAARGQSTRDDDSAASAAGDDSAASARDEPAASAPDDGLTASASSEDHTASAPDDSMVSEPADAAGTRGRGGGEVTRRD